MDKLKPKIISGSGNIFSLIDNRTKNIDKQYFITNIDSLCKFNNNITDGLIVINNSNLYNFDVLFINPDGTTGMMCGNGGRCAIFYYANTSKTYQEGNIVSFSMANNVYYGKLSNSLVSIYFDIPTNLSLKIFQIDNIEYKGLFIDTGTPHFVIETDELNDLDVNKIGKQIREHSIFKPNGTNVNFFQIISSNKIQLRTFERGVEAETGACGTGIIATAMNFFKNYGYYGKLHIIPKSESPLSIELTELFETLKIVLTGIVEEISF